MKYNVAFPRSAAGEDCHAKVVPNVFLSFHSILYTLLRISAGTLAWNRSIGVVHTLRCLAFHTGVQSQPFLYQ